ncbi:SDR family NAD(P)-dependent oxidoreductase [Actinomadura harenae]|uniref:SDR family NAD(P)-dependent oxidoreductase n=1 Tax=Actinomadura harenae TaxID=2483351 RepID=A0A3M2M085_9ACTN|nr:SDR family NAD(P)-dependent oxidoreductase [Actinomadura harenae]RMI43174.1 SDR family NAD(P)-dependent oxidoreductase [Actinomadura harenae]
METNPFDGKVVVVMAADTRPGKAVALELARCGATIAAHYRSSFETARSLVREIEGIGGFAVAFKADPVDPEQAESLCFRVHGALERIDLVVLNATRQAWTGDAPPAPRGPVELTGVLDTVRDRVLGCVAPAYAALPVMTGQGHGGVICLTGAGDGPPDLTDALVTNAVATVLERLAGDPAAAAIPVETAVADGPEAARLARAWFGRPAEAAPRVP